MFLNPIPKWKRWLPVVSKDTEMTWITCYGNSNRRWIPSCNWAFYHWKAGKGYTISDLISSVLVADHKFQITCGSSESLMPSMSQSLIFLAAAPLLCHCTFNNVSDPNWCWDGNCVVSTGLGGQICYHPTANETNSMECSGGHDQSPTYQGAINAHLAQGLSIAYYSLLNIQLGGISYTIPMNTNTTVCLSGTVGDGTYQTLCVPADTNNSIMEPGAYCIITVAQHYVLDGCYIAMPNTTTTSTISSLTAITSPTHSSKPLNVTAVAVGSGVGGCIFLIIVIIVIILIRRHML